MRKRLLLLLIAVAIVIYAYNGVLLFGNGLFGSVSNAPEKKTKEELVALEHLLIAVTPVRFDKKERDPFTLYTKKSAPLPVKKEPVLPKKEESTIKSPQVTLSGILWNPDNPVAIVKLSGGASKLVKAGQELDENFTVQRVEKNSITLVSGKREFVVEKSK